MTSVLRNLQWDILYTYVIITIGTCVLRLPDMCRCREKMRDLGVVGNNYLYPLQQWRSYTFSSKASSIVGCSCAHRTYKKSFLIILRPRKQFPWIKSPPTTSTPLSRYAFPSCILLYEYIPLQSSSPSVRSVHHVITSANAKRFRLVVIRLTGLEGNGTVGRKGMGKPRAPSSSFSCGPSL
jgi:hypothetical protein